jgi:hypothetical protein
MTTSSRLKQNSLQQLSSKKVGIDEKADFIGKPKMGVVMQPMLKGKRCLRLSVWHPPMRLAA